MADKKDLQKFIELVGDQLGIDKKILLVENIQDVPQDYKNLHMMINALKVVKNEYESKNSKYLEAFRYYSRKHRKKEISTEEFKSRFNKFKSKTLNRELVIA